MKLSPKRLTSLFVLVHTVFSTSSASTDPCVWKVSVVSSKSFDTKEVPFQNDRELLSLQMFLQNLKVNNMIPDNQTTYQSYPFFLHLQVVCGDQFSSQMAHTLVAIGVHPQVTITHEALRLENCHDGGKTKYTMAGALIDFNAGNNQKECNVSLCHPSWVCPLIMDECSLIVQVYVDTGSVDRLIQPTRHTIHADGYITIKEDPDPDTNGVVHNNILGSLVDIQDIDTSFKDRPYKITSIPSATPNLVIGGIDNSSIILMSSSEFQNYQIVEVSIPAADVICSDNMEPIKQVVSFPDRILLNTPAGLFEMFGFYGFLEDVSYSSASYGTLMQILPAQCIKDIVISPHVYTERVVMVAIVDRADMSVALMATVQSGIPVVFEEIVDMNKKPVCEAINLVESACSIVSAGISGVHEDSFLFLLQNKETTNNITYHLVSIQGSSEESVFSEWQELSQFSSSVVPIHEPGHDHPVQLAPTDKATTKMDMSLKITGLAFTGFASQHLFMWGKALLHSPDGGISVFLLPQYTSTSEILLLSVSHKNAFAFINDQEELWYGITGDTVELHQLRPSAGWTLQFSGISPSQWQQINDGSEQYTLTLFFDQSDQLFELKATKNSSDIVEVFRRVVPIADIVAYQEYITTQESDNMNHNIGAVGDPFATTESCPFITISFKANINQFNERIQHVLLSEPHLTNPDQVHTQDSIMVYQGIVHQAILQSSQDIPKVVGNKLYDPVARWKDSKALLKDYFEWQYRTKSLKSGIHVPVEEYGKFYEGNDHMDAELPSVVYLDLAASFNFTVYLSLNQPHVHTAPLDRLWLTVDVSDISIIEVLVSRTVNFLTNYVKYQVRVQDNGLQQQQSLSGLSLHPASVLLQVWNSAFKCAQHADIGHGELQGSYSMDVLLGCAPGKRLMFDLNATLEYAIAEHVEIYDCPTPHPDMPCFYYKQAFYPFFQVLDLVTGRADLFIGQYTFRVIGGSQGGLEDMRYFSKAEQDRYNLQDRAKDETLMWTPIDGDFNQTNDSAVIFTHDNNGLLWRCQQYSDCSDVPLKFPYAPEYYFLIEVSNSDVDANRTYCKFSVQFVIKVHGLPISPLRSVRIVLWSMGLLLVTLLMFVVWNHNKQHPIFKLKVKVSKKTAKVAPLMDYDEYTEYIQMMERQEKLAKQRASILSIDPTEQVLDVHVQESLLFKRIREEQEASAHIISPSQPMGDGHSRHFCNISEEPSQESTH